MKMDKTSPNVEFDIIYADETRHHAKEGILFEAIDGHMVLHLGTSRVEVLFAVPECLTETIIKAGLGEMFKRYIESRLPDEEAVSEDA